MSSIILAGSATGAGTMTVQAPETSSNRVLTLQDTSGTLAPLVSGTAQTVTGTSVDFTGIPSWVRRITVMFSGVSLSGTSNPIIQIGTAPATFKTSGYLGTATTGAGTSTNMSTGFMVSSASGAADIGHGISTLATIDGLIWTYNSIIAYSNQAATRFAAGSATSTSTIDRIRITTVNGTDTFDAGIVNIMYE